MLTAPTHRLIIVMQSAFIVRTKCQSFTITVVWADGHPTDEPCVSMEIGSGVDHQGHWIDGACQESNIYAICEKMGSAPPDTTTTSPPPPPPTCPGGWEEYEDSCYRAMEGKLTWEEAEIACVMEEVSLSHDLPRPTL